MSNSAPNAIVLQGIPCICGLCPNSIKFGGETPVFYTGFSRPNVCPLLAGVLMNVPVEHRHGIHMSGKSPMHPEGNPSYGSIPSRSLDDALVLSVLICG